MSLAERIQSQVPQEVFDKILKFTFAVEVRTVVNINRTYRPPSLLAIDRKSRESFAAEYYSQSNFDYLWIPYHAVWLNTLSQQHRAFYYGRPQGFTLAGKPERDTFLQTIRPEEVALVKRVVGTSKVHKNICYGLRAIYATKTSIRRSGNMALQPGVIHVRVLVRTITGVERLGLNEVAILRRFAELSSMCTCTLGSGRTCMPVLGAYPHAEA